MTNYKIVSHMAIWQFTRLVTTLKNLGVKFPMWALDKGGKLYEVRYDGRTFDYQPEMDTQRADFFFFDIFPADYLVFSSDTPIGVIFVAVPKSRYATDEDQIDAILQMAGVL